MISINSVEKSDCLKLIEIEKDLFHDPISIVELENYLNEDAIKIWKLQTTKIIGFVCFYHVKDEVEILKIGVLKSYQRKKYGSLIINEIKKLKIKKIFLEVSEQNINAINFYFKNGFKKIGVRKGYYASNDSSRTDALRLILKV